MFSPISVSIMLTILQQGARGHTEEELAKVLGCDAESTKVAYKSFIKKLLVRIYENFTSYPLSTYMVQ